MNNQNWTGIRSFLAVAEHGSFTAAADASGLSKAALSQQVSALELALGVQLLHRTTRKLRLTELGEGYLARCREAMGALTLADEWVTQSAGAMAGPLRVNTVGGLVGEELLAPLLLAFQQAYPEIELQLSFSSQQVDLLAQQYDLVIRLGALADSSLIGRQLQQMTTRYVASPAFIASHPPITQPADLKTLPLVCGSVSEWLFQREGEQQRIKVGQSFRIANGRVMCQAAMAGLGVARLIDVYVAQALAEGQLVEVLPQWREITPLTLLCPPAQYPLHRVRVLMDWLVQRLPERYEGWMSPGIHKSAVTAG